MVDSLRYKDWLEKSQKDLNAAIILKQNECGNDIVTFHCQQSIEKSLKGFLLYKQGEIIEGHSLIYLCKQSIIYDPGLKTFLKECAFVNQYYIETRYPADNQIIVTDEETEDCIKIAETIYLQISKNINNIID